MKERKIEKGKAPAAELWCLSTSWVCLGQSRGVGGRARAPFPTEVGVLVDLLAGYRAGTTQM